jgi:hypothetical protein
MPFFGWMSASLTLPKSIPGLAYAVIKAKSNLPISNPFLLSFICFSLGMVQEKRAFGNTFAPTTRHWPLLLLGERWTTPSMSLVVALTPLGFMESLFIELAPFYPQQADLLPGPSFIFMTLLKPWIIAWPMKQTAEQIGM